MPRLQDLAKSSQELVGRLHFEALVTSAKVPPPLVAPVGLDECGIAQRASYGQSLFVCAREEGLRKRSAIRGRELIETAFIDYALGNIFRRQIHQELIGQARAM